MNLLLVERSTLRVLNAKTCSGFWDAFPDTPGLIRTASVGSSVERAVPHGAAADSCPSFSSGRWLSRGARGWAAGCWESGPPWGLSSSVHAGTHPKGQKSRRSFACGAGAMQEGWPACGSTFHVHEGIPSGPLRPPRKSVTEPGLGEGGVCLVGDSGEGAFGKHLVHHDSRSRGRLSDTVSCLWGPWPLNSPAHQPCLSPCSPVPPSEAVKSVRG